MDGDQLGRLIYLVILGAAVIGWFIAQNRNAMGKTTQYAMIWGLIFIGVIGAFGLWGDIRNDILPRQSVSQNGTQIEVPRAQDGHYYLTLDLNGTPIQFTVDTGASGIVMSQSDARRIGIDTDTLAYLGQAQTANGIVRTAYVQLDVIEIGAIQDRNVPAYVNQGQMDGSLLGMDYLNRFDRIEITDNTLILTR